MKSLRTKVKDGIVIGYDKNDNFTIEVIAWNQSKINLEALSYLLSMAVLVNTDRLVSEGLEEKTEEEVKNLTEVRKEQLYDFWNDRFSNVLDAIIPGHEAKTKDPMYLAFLHWCEKHPEGWREIIRDVQEQHAEEAKA